MGAGAVNGHQNPNPQVNPTSNFNANSNLSQQQNQRQAHQLSSEVNHLDRTMKMSCEMCSTNFTLFKRKKFCQECHRYFCSTCLPKPPSSSPIGRQCSKCRLLISGNFTRGDLQNWKVKDIRCFLDVRSVSTKGCREKHDLIELVLSQFCKERRNSLELRAEHDERVAQMAARLTSCDTGSEQPSSSASGSEEPIRGVSSEQPASSGEQSTVEAETLSREARDSDSPPTSNARRDEETSRVASGNDTPESGGETMTESQPNQSEQQHEETSLPHLSQEELRNFLQEQVREFLQSEINNHEPATRLIETPAPPPPQPSSRCNLEDIKSSEAIDSLGVRQLKELLVNNFVDFKGCCEKPELILRVKRLWSDFQENKVKAEKIHQAEEQLVPPPPPQPSDTKESATSSTPATIDQLSPDDQDLKPESPPQPTMSSSPPKVVSEEPSDTLCRVCMDSLTNCILLECGHMVTCTTCGKKLAECPICRQYISRVVRVFRS